MTDYTVENKLLYTNLQYFLHAIYLTGSCCCSFLLWFHPHCPPKCPLTRRSVPAARQSSTEGQRWQCTSAASEIRIRGANKRQTCHLVIGLLWGMPQQLFSTLSAEGNYQPLNANVLVQYHWLEVRIHDQYNNYYVDSRNPRCGTQSAAEFRGSFNNPTLLRKPEEKWSGALAGWSQIDTVNVKGILDLRFMLLCV